MGYAFVQNTNNSNGISPLIQSFTNVPTAGNLLLASITDQSSVTQPVVSDTLNGNWALLSSEIKPATSGLWLFGALAGVSQPKPVTITESTSSIYIAIYELSGNPRTLSGIVDTSAGTTGASASTTNGSQPSITTTNADDFMITTLSLNSTITVPSVTGSSFALAQQTDSGNIRMVDATQIGGGTGTYNPFFSWTGAHTWIQLTTALIPGTFSSAGNVLEVMT